MIWLTVLKTALAIILAVAKVINDRQLLMAGEKQQVARDLAAIQARLGISALVATEVSNLSDSDLDAQLQGDQ